MEDNKNVLTEEELKKVSGGDWHNSGGKYKLIYKCSQCGYKHETYGNSDYKSMIDVIHNIPSTKDACSNKALNIYSHEYV